MIYLKKSPTNVGPFSVRVDPDSNPATAYYVDITDEPQGFVPGIAAGLLASYPRQLESVAIEDVPTDLLHPDDAPRFDCEHCEKDYASQSNLDRHMKSSHGNILEQLLTTEPVAS